MTMTRKEFKIRRFGDWVIVGPYNIGNLYSLYHSKDDKKDKFCGNIDTVNVNGIVRSCVGCNTNPPENLVNLTLFLRGIKDYKI